MTGTADNHAVSPYRAPGTVAEEPPWRTGSERPFYVIEPRQFLFLMIGTLGLYSFNWFYSHWYQLKRTSRADFNPAARALLAPLYAHSLFKEIDNGLQQAVSRTACAWAPQYTATVYVASAFVSGIYAGMLTKFVPASVAGLLGLLLAAPMMWAAYRAQIAANVAAGDPSGSTNSKMTVTMFIWTIFGGWLLWRWVLRGLFVMLGLMPVRDPRDVWHAPVGHRARQSEIVGIRSPPTRRAGKWPGSRRIGEDSSLVGREFKCVEIPHLDTRAGRHYASDQKIPTLREPNARASEI